MKQLPEVNILDVNVTNASKEDVLEFVFETLQNSSKKLHIFTPNPEIVMYANRHESFKKLLNRAEIKLADGVGLVLAAQILKKGNLERISGVDFMELLCKESVRKGATVGFLGGRNQVALKTALCLQKKYPGLKVSFIGEEWESGEWIQKADQQDLEGYEKQKKTLMPRVHLSQERAVDILFVAYGFPKQEEWISSHSEEYPFRVGMGVGGSFDYFSGDISRAPGLVRNVGLEWFYRLVRQPWRIKRQIALLSFLRLVLKERTSK